MNLNIGKNHIFMNKCESDGATQGVKQEIGQKVHTTLNTPNKIFLDINTLFLGDFTVNPKFHVSQFSSIFHEDTLFPDNPLQQKIFSMQEKYNTSQDIDSKDFDIFMNENGISMIDEFCLQFENDLGEGKISIDSNKTGFAVYLVLGFQKEFENFFSENMTFDVPKIQQMFQFLYQEFITQKIEEKQKISLHRIIVFCNLMNAICINSQLDVERKDQIGDIIDFMGELIIRLIENIRNSKNADIQELLGNLVYIYHRNIVVHSYTRFIPTNNSDTGKIINDFSEIIVSTIRSAHEIVDHKDSMIPISIGNISYLMGVLISKIKDKQLSSSEQNILGELIKKYHTFIHSALSDTEKIGIDTLSFFKKNTLDDVLGQLTQLFQLVSYLLVLNKQKYIGVFIKQLDDDGVFVKKLLNKSENSITDGETIHHIIMLSGNIDTQSLEQIFYKLLDKKYSSFDVQLLGLKNIDVTLKKLKEKGVLQKKHLQSVEEYLSQTGVESRLLIAYSRLYLTLAYFYLGENNSEKTKKYLFKFSKIRDMDQGFGIYLRKYGFDEHFFYDNIIELLEYGESEIIIQDGEKDDVILGYLSKYTNEYYFELMDTFLSTLDILRQSNQYNINIIYDFIKENVFYGICDVSFGAKDIVPQKGQKIFPFEDSDGNVILTFVYREQYEDMFQQFLRLSRKSLLSMIKFSQKLLQLDENEQKLLQELKDALGEERLVGLYQPITDRNGNIVYYEMLMRILSEDKTDIKYRNPVPFIEVGRKKGFIPEITSTLIDQVLSDLKQYPNLRVSINMDANDLLDDIFFEKIKKYFRNTQLCRHISFEILESAWVGDKKDEIYNRLKILTSRPYNIEFALDDFGTGEASIVKLMELLDGGMIKKIKIDGELVKNLSPNKITLSESKKFNRTLSMLRGIFEAAKNDNVQIVCEYIRDLECFHKMNGLFSDIDLLYQGWGAGGKEERKPAEVSYYNLQKK